MRDKPHLVCRLTQGSDIHGIALADLEARMRPGNFSQAGFIGPDESLAQVLDTDAQGLRELGVSAAALTESLGRLLQAAVASNRTLTRVRHFKIRLQRYKGVQICPFAPQPHENPCPHGSGMRFASIDWEIRNTRTGARLSGPGLLVHLIGAHAFFEGLQSPYRVSPRALAELLELGPFAVPA